MVAGRARKRAARSSMSSQKMDHASLPVPAGLSFRSTFHGFAAVERSRTEVVPGRGWWMRCKYQVVKAQVN
jgi:hypothetical protein